jgi:hypothetical protein
LFTQGNEVKVSHRRLAAIGALPNALIFSSFGITTLFDTNPLGLPLENGSQNPHLEGKKRNES